MHQAALKKQELENKLKHELTKEDDYRSNVFLTETKAGMYTTYSTPQKLFCLSSCDTCHIFIMIWMLCSSFRRQWTLGWRWAWMGWNGSYDGQQYNSSLDSIAQNKVCLFTLALMASAQQNNLTTLTLSGISNHLFTWFRNFDLKGDVVTYVS